MRFINFPFPPFYVEAIDKLMVKYANAREINREFIDDILFVVAQGKDAMWSYLCSIDDLVDECARAYFDGRIKNIRLREAELFTLRMDLIDFAESPFVMELKDDPTLKLEEKFELVVAYLDGIIGSNSLPPSVKAGMSSAKNSNSASAAPPSGGGALPGPGSGPGSGTGATGSYDPTPEFFKGLSFLFNMQHDKAVGQYHAQKEQSGQVGRSLETATHAMYKEVFGKKLTISNLVDRLYRQNELAIFEIAHNIDIAFAISRKGKLVPVDHVASNISVDKLRRFKDITCADRSDLAVDETFDMKVMKKSLRVRKFKERKDKKQCLYALLDGSGSTDEMYSAIGIDRIMYIKAIAIALGKKAIREEGEFHFRWFDGGIQNMFSLKTKGQWNSFLSAVLSRRSSGGTNIDLAMHTATKDIKGQMEGVDLADMLVVTDGTTDVTDVKSFSDVKKKGLKMHFVTLDFSGSLPNIKKLADSFHEVKLADIASLEEYTPEFSKVV